MEFLNPLNKFISIRTHYVAEYVKKSCVLAFDDDLESIELLRTMEDKEYFIAFEIYFKKDLSDGLDCDKLEAFRGCFNLANSPCSFNDYTLYARDNQLSMAFAVIPKAGLFGGGASMEWKDCYASSKK